MLDHERFGAERKGRLGGTHSLDPGAVAGLVAMATLGTAFGLLALGVDWFWVAFPVGFGGVMPVAVGATKRRHDGADSRVGRRHDRDRDRVYGDEADAALALLRERYARGELDEAAFEARLERLLRTEDVAAADEFVRHGIPNGRGGTSRTRPASGTPPSGSPTGIEDASDREGR